MIIAIDEAVADNPAALQWLDGLLRRFDDGWHLWDVTGLENIEDTLWITDSGTRGKGIMELYRKAVERSSWSSGKAPHCRRIRVVQEPLGDIDLAPEPALRLADEQLIVLVENRDSDGAFLKRIFQELDPSLWAWWDQSPAPARLDSVGGKGQMRLQVRKYEGISPKPRLVVVVDSDRRVPADNPSTDAQRLRNTCDALGFQCWILEKREAENYLPRALLDLRKDAGQEHRNRVEAWVRLSDEQKDTYNMKDGLNDMPGPAEEDLFADLSPTDRTLLSQGFGDNVGSCWQVYEGRNTSAIRERGQGDIELGLALIRKEV